MAAAGTELLSVKAIVPPAIKKVQTDELTYPFAITAIKNAARERLEQIRDNMDGPVAVTGSNAQVFITGDSIMISVSYVKNSSSFRIFGANGQSEEVSLTTTTDDEKTPVQPNHVLPKVVLTEAHSKKDKPQCNCVIM